MESEFQVLNNIDKNKNATQRDIAKNTGMSLGSVNILIKRLVKKGLLKIERLNPRTIRYILTPQGIKEKAEATYKYIVASYRLINDINSKIDELIESHPLDKENSVLLMGNQDEVYSIITNKLNQARIQYRGIKSDKELSAISSEHSTILVWHPDYSEILRNRGINYINLLEKV